jgi:endonuclease/exonuclease/phosphatase family metal-dependent hydrolase
MTAEPALHLRLLSLNCLGGRFPPSTRARLIALTRLLEASDYDVVCLQEVQYTGYLPLLRELLPSYPWMGHDTARRLHAPLGGLVTLSRWPLEDQTFSRYSERGYPIGLTLADRLLRKGVLTTRLRVREQPVLVLNTHLIANYSGNWAGLNHFTRQQVRQVDELRAIVDAADPALPLVLTGDFNLPRGCWLYDRLVDGSHLCDLMAGSTEPTYRQSYLLPGRYAQPIDFIFVRPPAGWDLAADAETTLREKVTLPNGRLVYLSDHVALHADIQLTSAEC